MGRGLLIGDLVLWPTGRARCGVIAVRQEDGAYLARCVYGFPVRDLDARARLALLVADLEGREVGRFTIDLALMR